MNPETQESTEELGQMGKILTAAALHAFKQCTEFGKLGSIDKLIPSLFSNTMLNLFLFDLFRIDERLLNLNRVQLFTWEKHS